MICETQLISIISNNNNSLNNQNIKIKKINLFASSNIVNFFYKSKLKSKLNYIYHNTNIPKESLYISLYYLYKYSNNTSNNLLNLHNIDLINNYVLASIIIANKQLLDFFNVKNFCNIMDFNFDLFCKIELDILKKINWNTFCEHQEYLKFKSFLEHYMD